MDKIKIRVITLGHVPYSLNIDKIKKWDSELFEIVDTGSYIINSDSDLLGWSFSDDNIEKQLPNRGNEDVLLAITNVPIEDNYFARRLSDNKVCLTYKDMTEILMFNNIPLENLVLRTLYAISFVYRRYENRIPPISEKGVHFTHDETKGCIFDMCGIKTDIVYSLDRPKLCHNCVGNLTSNRIDTNIVNCVQNELKKIRKAKYYRIFDWIKKRPIGALIISIIGGIFLGIISSILATYIIEITKTPMEEIKKTPVEELKETPIEELKEIQRRSRLQEELDKLRDEKLDK